MLIKTRHRFLWISFAPLFAATVPIVVLIFLYGTIMTPGVVFPATAFIASLVLFVWRFRIISLPTNDVFSVWSVRGRRTLPVKESSIDVCSRLYGQDILFKTKTRQFVICTTDAVSLHHVVRISERLGNLLGVPVRISSGLSEAIKMQKPFRVILLIVLVVLVLLLSLGIIGFQLFTRS